MRLWGGVACVLAVALLGCAQLSSAACPALTVNFFPEGSKNVPTGWTREAQVAAGNEDSSSLNTIKLTPSPAPKLFVQPVHPFFSRKACVPSDCLPAGKGRHLLATGRNSRIAPLRQQPQQQAEEEEQEDAVAPVDAAELELLQENAAAGEAPVVAELQRMDADSNGLSRGLNNLLWNLPYNPFGRRRGSSSSSSGSNSGSNSPAAPAPSSSTSSSSTAAPSDAASPAAPPTTTSSSSDNGSKDAAAAPAAGEDLEAGTGALAPIIGRGGSGSNSLKESISGGGWTEWKEDEDWWGGEERNLQACLTTVAQPAAYDILWNIDGGLAKKATMPKQGAPFILLDNLDTLAPGKHTLNIKATMLKGTSEVNGVPSLQPPQDQVYSTKVVFNLVEGKGDAPGAVEPSDAKAAKPADPKAAAAEGEEKPAAAAEGEKPAAAAEGQATAPAEGEAKPAAEKKKGPEVNVQPTVDAAVAQQAVKYYCMRQYNVGGKIHSQKNVTAGDEGVNQCAVACNALKGECAGFGLSVNKCFLMKAFSSNSSAADATLDALCMKSANDWLDFGIQTSANSVGGGFFCLRGYDIKGDPAGTGDMENPVQTANTELAGMTPSTCATQCRGTAGCQYLIMKKPTVPGGTATCYLKMHALGGLYGNTGPAKDTVDFTCFNGQEAWMTFGGQLDYAVPSPEVNTGVQTPALAAVAPGSAAVGPTGGAKTYRCIKGYLVNGTAMGDVQVSMGDEGLSQCAGKCDEAPGCVGYSMIESGQCSMLKAIDFNVTGPSPKTYGMCFGSPADWNKFGNPDGSGMYCVKQYDFAGDGVRTVDYMTITAGAGAVQFCKQQCAAEPQCQFSVTSLGKCYMKQNILSGSFGTTKPDTSVDASCVKGEQNWALAALQVSAAPAGSLPGAGGARGPPGSGGNRAMNFTAARKTTLRSGAGSSRLSGGWAALLSAAAAVLLSCLVAL